MRQRKILHIGLSDTPSWIVSEGQAIARMRGWTPISAIQIHYNLVERTSEADMIPMANHHDITPLAWSPLAGGVLARKYIMEDFKKEDDGGGRKSMSQSMGQLNERSIEIGNQVKEIAKEIDRSASQVSLNWLLQQLGVTIAIVCARKLSYVEDNLAVDFTLTPEQCDRLNEGSNFEPLFYNFLTPQLIDSMVDGETKIEEAQLIQQKESAVA